MTEGESFLWYKATDRLQVGVAYLWKQGAFRGLGNYVLIEETARLPNLKAGLGLQGIATGNPGYFVTSEKNFSAAEGSMNMFGGIGLRANEDHAHPLAGMKFSPAKTPFTFGFQWDGHGSHFFGTVGLDSRTTIGAYLIESKLLGIMLSVGF